MGPTPPPQNAPSGFELLLQPLDVSRFMERSWGRRHEKWSGTESPAMEFLGRSPPLRLGDLLRLSTGGVLVCLTSPDGEYRTVRVSPGQAAVLYDSGVTLYFDLDSGGGVLGAWRTGLAQSLGIDVAYVKVSAFAARAGGKTECHFDSNENFTVQLTGRKRWSIAPNQHIQAPLERFTVSHEPTESLRRHSNGPLPVDLPGDAHEVTLEAGDRLYVPRGAWHEVQAISDSLSLNFCVQGPTLASLVVERLYTMLTKRPEWRAFAIDPPGYASRGTAEPRRLEHLITVLGSRCDLFHEGSPTSSLEQPGRGGFDP